MANATYSNDIIQKVFIPKGLLDPQKLTIIKIPNEYINEPFVTASAFGNNKPAPSLASDIKPINNSDLEINWRNFENLRHNYVMNGLLKAEEQEKEEVINEFRKKLHNKQCHRRKHLQNVIYSD